MRYADCRGLFVVALIIQLNKYKILCTMIVPPQFPGLVDEPICDDLYRDKYQTSLSNFRSHNSHRKNPMINYANDPSEFMPVDRSSNDFLVETLNESEEFLIHDDRDNPYSFMALKKWRQEKSKPNPAKRQREIKKFNVTNAGSGKNVKQRKPEQKGSRGKSKEDTKKKKNTPLHSSATLNGLSTRNSRKNLTKFGLRSSLGWANLACDSARRIVGGWVSESIEKLPYMVFLDTGCGGAIIGSGWVLTAAHCIAEQAPTYVYVGSVDIVSGCQYIVAAIHVHPHFSKEELQSDLGMIEIKPNFVYSPAVQPIALTKIRARFKMCGIVAGWGAKVHNGAMSTQLMMTHIPVVARKRCRKFQLKKGEFCAGYSNGKADSCQGDSGGGFVVSDQLVGIVSYGDECAKLRSPGVYVDVFHYLNWIRKISGIS